MMPVRLDRFGVLVSGQDDVVSRRLQPKAEAATTTEEICSQMCAFGPEASRVGQE
jgi:hypothetical protein